MNDKNLINYIGNITLLEGKNSQNGQRGNSSLGSIDYVTKKTSYSNSSVKVTRDIVKVFDKETFLEIDIIKRTKLLAKKIEEYTNYF